MLTRRLLQLFIGLAMYGISLALFIRAGLGLDPWDVFHQGVAGRTGLSIGVVVIIVSFLVLLLWIPLRQRPGFGTLCNAVLVGVFADVGLALIPAFSHLGGQIAMLVGAVVLNGIASACYIGARFGPGARDGLMTGLARRTGWSVRIVPHPHRSGGARRGLAAGRFRGRGHRGLRPGHRAAGAAAAAMVHGAGSRRGSGGARAREVDALRSQATGGSPPAAVQQSWSASGRSTAAGTSGRSRCPVLPRR